MDKCKYSRNSSILPLTTNSEKLLSNLVVPQVSILPNFGVWQHHDILLDSQPELIWYSFSKMGVNYIFLTAADNIDNEGFLESLLFSFPQVYSDNENIVFKVPVFPIYNDSSFVLVKSQNDLPTRIEAAFSYLIASQINFSIADTSAIRALTPGFTYLFADKFPSTINRDQLMGYISQGAKVITQSPNELLKLADGVTAYNDVPTNSTNRWTIETNLADKIKTGLDTQVGDDIFSNVSTQGSFIYRYSNSINDLQFYSSIKVWVKTSSTGNFYFGLGDGPKNEIFWAGQYDSRYIITENQVNKWIEIAIPLDQPTYRSEIFSLSNISYLRIGMDGMQNGTCLSFSIAGIRFLKSITSIDFIDGNSIPTSGLSIAPAPDSPSFGRPLAFYSGKNALKIPYLTYCQIGSGSLILLNADSLNNIQSSNEYPSILNATASTLYSFGVNDKSTDNPKEKWLPLNYFGGDFW